MDANELLHESKTPTSKKNYVGIEIEFLTPRGDHINKIKRLLIKNELEWYCHIGGDGSVTDIDFVPKFKHIVREFQGQRWEDSVIVNNNKRKVGHEIRILAQEDEAPDIVKKVCEIIVECNGIINSTCGLHIHIDLRNRSYDTVYHNMFMSQDLMFKTQPSSRTSNNKFCMKLTKKFKTTRTRYYAINSKAYKEHRTIEIRLHEPTLNSKDVLMWMDFLIGIANIKTCLKKKVSTVEDLDFLPDNLKGHLNERIEKYSRKSNSKTA